eukprot:CAMPEP_0173062362 /NCGR_PEP_ID=MMETSP1102-20130122/3771_1 /TAXON_ID=49646 /ORGANISM="Geminigera sp., Strain Caron Lab Isolate" /LENGTH=486 /DNA_ID=CAMNT_0013929015 /DNA_START=1304 /DNA_END=2764 /DNA_ORIENTATION=+
MCPKNLCGFCHEQCVSRNALFIHLKICPDAPQHKPQQVEKEGRNRRRSRSRSPQDGSFHLETRTRSRSRSLERDWETRSKDLSVSKKTFHSKPGDWTCNNCGELVFAFRSACRICRTSNPEGAGDVSQVRCGGEGKDEELSDSQILQQIQARATASIKEAFVIQGALMVRGVVLHDTFSNSSVTTTSFSRISLNGGGAVEECYPNKSGVSQLRLLERGKASDRDEYNKAHTSISRKTVGSTLRTCHDEILESEKQTSMMLTVAQQDCMHGNLSPNEKCELVEGGKTGGGHVVAHNVALLSTPFMLIGGLRLAMKFGGFRPSDGNAHTLQGLSNFPVLWTGKIALAAGSVVAVHALHILGDDMEVMVPAENALGSSVSLKGHAGWENGGGAEVLSVKSVIDAVVRERCPLLVCALVPQNEMCPALVQQATATASEYRVVLPKSSHSGMCAALLNPLSPTYKDIAPPGISDPLFILWNLKAEIEGAAH